MSIVDVGYGNGVFLEACTRVIPIVIGCDISDYPVPEGCSKKELTTIGSVDIVCFFDSLEHFEDITIIKDLDTQYRLV